MRVLRRQILHIIRFLFDFSYLFGLSFKQEEKSEKHRKGGSKKSIQEKEKEVKEYCEYNIQENANEEREIITINDINIVSSDDRRNEIDDIFSNITGIALIILMNDSILFLTTFICYKNLGAASINLYESLIRLAIFEKLCV